MTKLYCLILHFKRKMDKVTVNESYKLYRELNVFKALKSALIEMCKKGEITSEFAVQVVQRYDKIIMNEVSKSDEILTFKGHLPLFRVVLNHSYFALTNVTFKDAKGKKLNNKPIDLLKMWAYRPTADKMEEVEDLSPYVVKICKMKKKEKKKG